mgnify:CR=1 FL=1
MAEEQEKKYYPFIGERRRRSDGLFGAVNKAALKTMREAGKRYFEDFKNSISCFLLSFLTIRLVGAATIHATYCR